MAKAAKPKKVIIIDSTDDTPDEIVEKIIPLVAYEDEPINADIQSEEDFLIGLLRAQEDGNWHGPAAGLIRERLKLISNG